MTEQLLKIKPELDIHVSSGVLTALQAQAITRLSVLASHIRSVAVEPWTLESYTGDLSLLDEGIRIILDIFKEQYKTNGWIDDGTVQDYPIRQCALDTMLSWEKDIAASWLSAHPGVTGEAFDPALCLMLQR